MLKKVFLPSIAVVVALGVIGVFNGMNIENEQKDVTILQREKITDFSQFPMPTLPSANVLEKSLTTESLRNTDYVKNLPNGYELTSVLEDPYYGETTLVYTKSEISSKITNEDSIQDLVRKGAVVFDYEKIDNLAERTSAEKSIFMTKNSNPVFVDNGLNGEYLTIAYVNDNIRLSIYGNDSIDLKDLVKSLDL